MKLNTQKRHASTSATRAAGQTGRSACRLLGGRAVVCRTIWFARFVLSAATYGRHELLLPSRPEGKAVHRTVAVVLRHHNSRPETGAVAPVLARYSASPGEAARPFLGRDSCTVFECFCRGTISKPAGSSRVQPIGVAEVLLQILFGLAMLLQITSHMPRQRNSFFGCRVTSTALS